MIGNLFLNAEDLQELTGFVFKDKQIQQLRSMGIPFHINGCGKPVVTRVSIEGGSQPNKISPSAWNPAVLHEKAA